MEVMAVPNPRAYVLKKEDIEAAKSLTIGIEDGWIDGSTDEAMEKYQEAKDALSYFDLIKTIKSDAYREFAAKLKKEAFKIDYCDSTYNVVDIDDFDYVLNELEGKL